MREYSTTLSAVGKSVLAVFCRREKLAQTEDIFLENGPRQSYNVRLLAVSDKRVIEAVTMRRKRDD